MRKFNKAKFAGRVLLLLLALAMLVPSASCANKKGKTLLTLEKDGVKATFSVNLYELMLSRIKGALVGNGVTSGGYSANEASFWNTVGIYGDSDKKQTLSEFYGEMILENCKTYVVADWLFRKEGLTLSDTATAEVEQQLDDLVNGYGTKTKLNAVLSDYGVNYNMLKEAYLLEKKVTALQDYYYGSDAGLVDNSIKDVYLSEHYVRFRQINIPLYKFVYVTDANGDDIYYVKDSDTSKIAYDTKNGYKKADEKHPDDYVRDDNDEIVYYKDQTYSRIAYDTVNGVRSYVLDSSGTAKTAEMTESEKASQVELAETVLTAMTGADAGTFEAKMEQLNEYGAGEDAYTDGYYLSVDTDYASAGDSFAYLSEITEKLKSANVGDVVKIESSDAIHIVRKYEVTSGAYDLDVNEPWFEGFGDALIEELFLEKCEEYFGDITVDGKILASATDIRKIGTNLYLY